ncbi:MAG: 50S ribosomal protein L27, partial [Candidatus Vogelbacteria bacterium]|nr:50S ribosomal protein L27 [Candidatus Vogelbacteria bacterium]
AVGKDHTLFAKKAGTVKFGTARKIKFNGKTNQKTIVRVI